MIHCILLGSPFDQFVVMNSHRLVVAIWIDLGSQLELFLEIFWGRLVSLNPMSLMFLYRLHAFFEIGVSGRLVKDFEIIVSFVQIYVGQDLHLAYVRLQIRSPVGGPVGLFLAQRISKQGISFFIMFFVDSLGLADESSERRSEPPK